MNFGLSFGLLGGGEGRVALPSWYKIASLDPSDILGVWDMSWAGHQNSTEALRNMDGTMPDMSIDSGSPSWLGPTEGFSFGGSGSILSSLPDGLDMRDLTALMEFHDVEQNNSSLDAFYSHYLDNSNGHYTLQNDWPDNEIRWSCGDSSSGTIDVGSSTVLEGIICTAGRNLYYNNVLLGTMDDSGVTSSTSLDFRVGCIWSSGNRTQYAKFKLKKLLLVRRVLTESEVHEITYNIAGIIGNVVTHNGETVTHNGEIVIWQ